jgi:hypothetical protein
VNGSLARIAIRHLEKEGQIKRIVHHSAQLVYSTSIPGSNHVSANLNLFVIQHERQQARIRSPPSSFTLSTCIPLHQKICLLRKPP